MSYVLHLKPDKLELVVLQLVVSPISPGDFTSTWWIVISPKIAGSLHTTLIQSQALLELHQFGASSVDSRLPFALLAFLGHIPQYGPWCVYTIYIVFHLYESMSV